MPRKKKVTFWATDFETTVWGDKIEKEKGVKQNKTEVWSAASVALYDVTETVIIHHSIRDFLKFFLKQCEGNNILYFHNLSFDGSFIVDFLLRNEFKFSNEDDKDLKSGMFKTCISKMGSWYYIKIKLGHNLLEIRNSLKLIPSSLAQIGKSFETKHRKLDMEYEGERYAYCDIKPDEEKYIKNDVLVLKEALERMFNEGHDKLTIGSCCLSEFKSGYDKQDYSNLFPDLSEEPSCTEQSAWEYVHKSYHGGWCYVNPKYARTILFNGVVYDVNSLYPSMMHSISGNRYPVGKPKFWEGEIPNDVRNSSEKYYFVRFTCRFKVKESAFPWLHIRGSHLYKGNDNLYTSDVKSNGVYSRYYIDNQGNIQDTVQELTMTCTDFQLFQDTYDIYDLHILSGCWFYTQIGIFDNYINYYKELKMKSKGFLRTLAKLFLNNLYGKLAMSDDSSYKEPYLDTETNTVKFILHEEHNKSVGYIPCGSAITSYAMNFTVRAAIANKERFCYADTDSIHLIGFDDAIGIVEDPAEFCCWKQESHWNMAYYSRQKCYVESIIEEDHTVVTPYLDIKCAGMSNNAKQEFVRRGYSISQLDVGLQLEDCNLKATRIPGGILLRNKTFKMRKSIDKQVNTLYNDIVR